ncbi:hypothetical protein [Pajaroellobacter abortibovis]|uniref:Uncharacterized protein n=1 Tax=Pajaroellobacter abortibovis TaxID=1882918 RepID=A0A1L6MWU8_9BACT|nr:hypothetical protein [Pajaroellobacter abortibovis]APR99898.1 hypothetical protein BCY86_03795 [Pajaroellobacter abortibovis]
MRARQILRCVILEHITTGEPVGSRVLSEKTGLHLSPASIRNILSHLEDNGISPSINPIRVQGERR